MRVFALAVLVLPGWFSMAAAGADTLKSQVEIIDGTIYSWKNCNSEVYGENCQRYNAGGVRNLGVGRVGDDERRSIFGVPGWDGVMPDSSHLLLYCKAENDSNNRRVFIYPLTAGFIEGSELAWGWGDYPDPDSGVTWLHAWLDTGDRDSCGWSMPGGDFTSAVACTVLVSDTGRYVRTRSFNRVLSFWDSSGQDYGFIAINQNAAPSDHSLKVFGSSEGDTLCRPMVVLFYPDTMQAGTGVRRRRGTEQSLIR